jgi:hypothetical protein
LTTAARFGDHPTPNARGTQIRGLSGSQMLRLIRAADGARKS